MKRIIFLAALLLPIVVQALPFKPTSDPALASTFWSFVKYNEYYMAAETEDEQLAFPETVSAVDDIVYGALWEMKTAVTEFTTRARLNTPAMPTLMVMASST